MPFGEFSTSKMPPNHELIHLPTKEVLSHTTERELQRLGDQGAEILGMHLGINLSDLEVFRTLLAHLNHQNTGKVDRLNSYKENYQKIIAPQMKVLTEMLEEQLNPVDWEVRVSNSILAGDMIHIIIKHKAKDLEISFYERGFYIDSPELEISWNIFPPKSTDDDYFGTYISFFHRPSSDSELASALRIQSESMVKGDGLVMISNTDSSRAGLKPRMTEILQPRGMCINAVYSPEGTLQNIRLVFTIPGQKPSLAHSIVAVYDCQELHPGNNLVTPQSYLRRSNEPVTLPEQPDIFVSLTKLHIKYLNQSATFPLEVGTPTELGKHILSVLETHFPARIPFSQLNESNDHTGDEIKK